MNEDKKPGWFDSLLTTGTEFGRSLLSNQKPPPAPAAKPLNLPPEKKNWMPWIIGGVALLAAVLLLPKLLKGGK
jgi:hypothetical protein